MINLISFYSEITNLTDGEGAVDIVCLDFSKNTVPHKILIEKLLKYMGCMSSEVD